MHKNSAHGPSELAHVDYLDGWRGLAIGLVLIDHFVPLSFIDAGRLGVDLFFCLSGLLMSNILFVKRTPLITFYKRRISRIFPAFVIYVVVVFAASWITSGVPRPVEFLDTITFLRTYLPAGFSIWDTPVPIGHLWSLNAEEHSYVFLSSLTVLGFLRGREWLGLFAAGLLSIVLAAVYFRYQWAQSSGGRLGTEVVMTPLMLSAGYFLVCNRSKPYIRPWMPVAAMMAAAFLYSTAIPSYLITNLLAPFALAFAVNHLAQSPASLRAFLALPAMRVLGIWSFSLYLWQQPFHEYVDHRGLNPVVGLILSFAVGLVSFYLIENPLRSVLNRRWITAREINGTSRQPLPIV